MKIHLTGVGGVAMGNLAAMLKRTGHTVTGSDSALYPPMSEKLKDWGIEAFRFDEKNLEDADLVVIGNVISRGNPEVEAVLNRKIPYMSMSAALKEFFLKGKDVIVVAGTHGKTTTTFLIDHILATAGKAPGLFAGGLRSDGMNGFRVSDSPYFVIEGDEYDTAFFDKASKFLHYLPRYLVLTSVEFDHADIFHDFREYSLSFQRLLRLIPSEGLVIGCADNEGVKNVLKDHQLSPVEWYSRAAAKGVSSFVRKGALVEFPYAGTVEELPLIGDHNISNALAAVLLARRLGISADSVRMALRTFPGVLRRQQVRAQKRVGESEVRLIEDFAHHPTAVKETILAVRQAYPGFRIHALFEPRSATSHRSVFQAEYARALASSDSVYITDVYDRKKVDASSLLNVKKIVADISKRKGGKTEAFFAKDPQALLAMFRKKFRPSKKGDIILIMSNGAFGGIYPELDTFVRAL